MSLANGAYGVQYGFGSSRRPEWRIHLVAANGFYAALYRSANLEH